jgi:6-phosphogluconolactonase (cycloisomerase 2 family)
MLVAVIVAIAVPALGLLAAPALGAEGDPFFNACINAGTAQGSCASAPGMTAAFPEVLSPDGKELYVAVAGGTPPGGGPTEDAAVFVFDRNTATGAVTRRISGPTSCVTSSGSSGACGHAPTLSNPQDMLVSPDGKSVYVTTYGTNSIVELARGSDGGLTVMSQCHNDTGSNSCVADTGMVGTPRGMAMDSLSKNLYVSVDGGTGIGSLLVYDRDGATGNLTQKADPNGCWSENGVTANCKPATGISHDSFQLALSPDDKSLYSTGWNEAHSYVSGSDTGDSCFPIFSVWICTASANGTIAIFGRNADGTLTQAAVPNGCLSSNGRDGGQVFASRPPANCKVDTPGLLIAHSAVVTPDNNFLYVGADNAVLAYQRDASTGALTLKDCRQTVSSGFPAPCHDGTAVGQAYRLAVTPDGSDLVAESNQFNGFSFFKRDAGTGALTQRSGVKGCVTQTGTSGVCETQPGFGAFGSVAVSNDSLFLYLTGDQFGALATYHRDFAPVCQGGAVSAPFNTSVNVTLTCSDVNGDPLQLGISKAPAAGTLAAVQQGDGAGNGSVRYSPALAFVGQDSFQFTATGNGVTSAPATITVNVQPAPFDPSKVDADGDGFNAAADCNDHDPKIHPGAFDIPGNGIDENCDGHDAPLPRITSAITHNWLINGPRFTALTLSASNVPAGATITISCKGKPRCSLKKKKTIKVSKTGKVNLLKSLTKKERKFRAGQRLEIQISAPGRIGKDVVLKFKNNGRAPSGTTRCLAPGSTRIIAC